MMRKKLLKSFTWEIDNFSEKKSPIKSTLFSSDGCEWYVLLHPKGEDVDDHLSLYLCVANPKSLRPGWKRRASLRFVILNQSGKEVHKTSEGSDCFCAEIPGWGFRKAMPLTKLQDKELLENNTLIIEVYTKVTRVFHKGDETGKELLDFRGFHVLPSQVISLSQILAKHPNFAVDIQPKSKAVKTAYMNILLGLIETLNKPPESFSETELFMAYSKLIDLTEVGFKLDWLKSKLDEVSLEWKKENAEAARVQELEENVKNLELMLSDLKVELDKEKVKSSTASAKVLSLEKTVSDLKVELNKEKAKSDTKPKVFSLKDDVSFMKTESLAILEAKSASAKVLSVSDLKVELDKEKAKSDTKPKVLSFKDDDVSFRKTESLGIRRRRSDYGKSD